MHCPKTDSPTTVTTLRKWREKGRRGQMDEHVRRTSMVITKAAHWFDTTGLVYTHTQTRKTKVHADPPIVSHLVCKRDAKQHAAVEAGIQNPQFPPHVDPSLGERLWSPCFPNHQQQPHLKDREYDQLQKRGSCKGGEQRLVERHRGDYMEIKRRTCSTG